jgi:DNA helicase-2/ATP-dependent DNA helicase PcrA
MAKEDPRGSQGDWLSNEQQAVVAAGPNIFLRACPGSGKTRTVAARVASENASDRNVALLSYTRIGASEISSAVSREHGTLLSTDHFVGTVHSFLQRFVLRPFGHLVTGSQVSMTMDPTEAERHSPIGLDLSAFQFDLNGDISRARRKQVRPTEIQEVLDAKRSNATRGFVNYDDAMYASMKVLKLYPHVAAALALRFDEIIVDEAQDTSAMQLECLRLIAEAGLKSMMLVGDYDQSIYGFSGASPEGCERLAVALGLTVMTLTENYRSSQVICNAAAAFRGDGTPDSAVGKYSDLGILPQVVFYEPGQEAGLLQVLGTVIETHGLTVDSAMILVRASALADQIRGGTRPKITGPIRLLLETRSAEALTLDQYRELEQLLVQRSFGLRKPNVRVDRMAIRNHAIVLAEELPVPEGDLASWAREAIRILDLRASLISPATVPISEIPVPSDWKRFVIEELATVPSGATVDTIHKAKGQSIDAVMLVAEKPSEDWHTSNAAAWSAGLAASKPAEISEEIRLAYVALTRARQLFVLALPHDTPAPIVKRYLDAGFALEASQLRSA